MRPPEPLEPGFFSRNAEFEPVFAMHERVGDSSVRQAFSYNGLDSLLVSHTAHSPSYSFICEPHDPEGMHADENTLPRMMKKLYQVRFVPAAAVVALRVYNTLQSTTIPGHEQAPLSIFQDKVGLSIPTPAEMHEFLDMVAVYSVSAIPRPTQE